MERVSPVANGLCVRLQVRGLAGTAFRSDAARFEEMAGASLALCRAYLAVSQSAAAVGRTGPAVTRELAAARMHLRGVLKQCEASFSEAPAYLEMQELLQQVLDLEEQASAGGSSSP
jgi:hypothetical protein